MSSLAWGLADALAPASKKARPSLWLRFIEAQQAKAARVVRAHIATMSDAELARFGWTEHQIRALRTGNRTANGTQGEVS
ncbi:MAG TPA: hypothetical protein VHM01_15305 [Alphaproteobacteria bacterium]|nr:hypothetical protein [Alphaproteobacteria bacterium]